MRSDNCLLTGERGSAMVELAICAPVLCLLFVGSMEFHKLTNYKRKVIGATRYACWEMVSRKGEANLERTVATEMRNLWFPEINFNAGQAVVNNFGNTPPEGVQLKVEKMSSLGDLTSSGGLVYGTTVGYAAAKGWDFKLFKLGYGLAKSNPDDRIKTTVRMTYKPTFFPIILGFLTLKESQATPAANQRPKSWNPNQNLMSVGGDVTFARMALCNGTWDEYRRDELIKRVEGMWCPLIGQILSEISSVTFGIVEFKCYVEPDLVCPTTYNPGSYQDVRPWWQKHDGNPKRPCQCTHQQNPRVQNGPPIRDTRQQMAAEKEELKRELRQRIADDTRQIQDIDAEIQRRQSDNDPNNDDVSALQSEKTRLQTDRTEAQTELDRLNNTP